MFFGLTFSPEHLSAYAAVIATLAAVYSVHIARRQLDRAGHIQRQATASQLWDAYLTMAVRYPIFAFPANFIESFDFERREFNGSREEFERYEWFLSRLLRTTDEIIVEFGYADHRSKTALQDVAYHAIYFRWRKAKNYKPDYLYCLSKPLQVFIEALVKARKPCPILKSCGSFPRSCTAPMTRRVSPCIMDSLKRPLRPSVQSMASRARDRSPKGRDLGLGTREPARLVRRSLGVAERRRALTFEKFVVPCGAIERPPPVVAAFVDRVMA